VKLVGHRKVFSVEEVTGRLAEMFEGLRQFWVEAEIEDVRAGGARVYFNLRGEHVIRASMKAVVWDRLPQKPARGDQVHAFGRMEFWRGRAEVTMAVERIEPSGEGLLLARIQELRRLLAADGLLAPERKRALPVLPRRIGLVTAPDGAARHDVLTTLWARFPADVVLAGVPVQGDAAPRSIERAIVQLNGVDGVDVIVVARGGGSLEDLMAFNSETVCRAVAASRVPVVSAVGHERDVTLCDEVADLRVATPTAAAAAVVPSAEALEARLRDADLAVRRGLVRTRADAEAAVGRRASALGAALRRPEAIGRDRVERLEPRMRSALARAAARAPGRVDESARALARAAAARRERAEAGLARAEGLLALLSPRRTVARGYAIVRDADGGAVIASAAAVVPGQGLRLELRDGRVGATATATEVSG
jgi:exodeoxyribonuclease VII large subunit